jgi:hypothetical protein
MQRGARTLTLLGAMTAATLTATGVAHADVHRGIVGTLAWSSNNNWGVYTVYWHNQSSHPHTVGIYWNGSNSETDNVPANGKGSAWNAFASPRMICDLGTPPGNLDSHTPCVKP